MMRVIVFIFGISIASLVGGNAYSQTGTSLTNCVTLIKTATFYVADPWNGNYGSHTIVSSYYGTGIVNVSTASFTNINDGGFGSFGLYLFQNNTSDYFGIKIDNNSFSGGASACRIEGFNQPLTWDGGNDHSFVPVFRIEISTNSFSGGTVGILSINSNIGSGNNTMAGVGTGILQTANGKQNPPQTTSTSCNDNISNSTTGIQGDNWASDPTDIINISLANISTCNVGINLQDNVNILLAQSSIKNCDLQGLLLKPMINSHLAMLDCIWGANTFELNNLTATANVTGQIELGDGGLLRFYNGNITGNNIIKRIGNPNPKGDVFILNSGPSIMAIGFQNNTGDDHANGNYWATKDGVVPNNPYDPYTPNLTTHTTVNNVDNPQGNLDPGILNLTYFDGSLKANHTGYYLPWSMGPCTFPVPLGYKITGKNQTPLSIEQDTGITRCQNLALAAQALKQAGNAQGAYDAYRAYIDTCAYLSNSWHSFIDVGDMNGIRSTDQHRFEEYRDWLKKVLYYNLDTVFYCADLNQILGTFGWFNDARGKDYKGNLAVMYFLVQTKRCGWEYIDTANIPATWNALYSAWLDTVHNPNLTPFDSTLPSIDSLGLGILRGPPAAVTQFIDSKLGPIINNIIALENPFSSETKIDFTLREAAAIKMEIYDVLGKRYYTTEKVFDEGDNQIILPGTGLPHGILYARFSASDGTVKTISLRHIE